MILLKRRGFLQAMNLGAGSSLLAPLFATLLPEAVGAAPGSRKRFVLLTHGGGLPVNRYTCSARSRSDFDLNAQMTALEPHKKQMVLVSPLYCPHDKKQHGNQFATLSMMPSSNQDYGDYKGFPPGGISIDRFLGRELGKTDAFDSTVQAISENGSDAINLSANGKDQPYPGIGSPKKAYEKFFVQNMVPKGVSADTIIAQNKSVFDFIRGDVKRMNSRLGSNEKAKLEQYIGSIQGVEKQLATLAQSQAMTCALPTQPNFDDEGLSEKVIDAHIAVMCAAQRCGLTRVSHFSIHGFSSPHNPYGWLGDSIGFHNNHHDSNNGLIDKIVSYVYSRVATVVDAFKSTPEGGGTMLDNSLIAFLNTCGGSHHDGHDTYSAFLFGSAGGAMKTGQYISYPPKEQSLGALWFTVAKAMGSTATVFGDPAHCKGPLPGVLA